MSLALTAETIAQLKSAQGHHRSLWPLNRSATSDAVRRFALGVGDDNPLWWGEDDAPGAFAPPTFLYTGLNFGSWPDLGGGPAQKAQPTVTLWAGDHWTWKRRSPVGEAFAARSEIADVREKRVDDAVVSVRQLEQVVFTVANGEEIARLVRTTVTLPRGETASAPPLQVCLTPAELRRIEDCYDAEPGRRRGAASRPWARVEAGDPLGPIVKGPLSVTGLVGWVIGWGAPLCPTNRMLRQWSRAFPDATVINQRTGWAEGPEGIHWDPDVFGAFGYERGFDFGPQRISWLAHLCTDWCGDAGVLRELDGRLLRANFIGDVTWLTGEVARTWREPDGRGLVELRLEGRNQRGELSTAGQAVIELPDL
jgi:acyl dehydratase